MKLLLFPPAEKQIFVYNKFSYFSYLRAVKNDLKVEPFISWWCAIVINHSSFSGCFGEFFENWVDIFLRWNDVETWNLVIAFNNFQIFNSILHPWKSKRDEYEASCNINLFSSKAGRLVSVFSCKVSNATLKNIL